MLYVWYQGTRAWRRRPVVGIVDGETLSRDLCREECVEPGWRRHCYCLCCLLLRSEKQQGHLPLYAAFLATFHDHFC